MLDYRAGRMQPCWACMAAGSPTRSHAAQHSWQAASVACTPSPWQHSLPAGQHTHCPCRFQPPPPTHSPGRPAGPGRSPTCAGSPCQTGGPACPGGGREGGRRKAGSAAPAAVAGTSWLDMARAHQSAQQNQCKVSTHGRSIRVCHVPQNPSQQSRLTRQLPPPRAGERERERRGDRLLLRESRRGERLSRPREPAGPGRGGGGSNGRVKHAAGCVMPLNAGAVGSTCGTAAHGACGWSGAVSGPRVSSAAGGPNLGALGGACSPTPQQPSRRDAGRRAAAGQRTQVAGQAAAGGSTHQPSRP